MTDLDRKIAELKGLLNAEGAQVKFHGPLDAPVNHPYWSTDTAKAFELVDEAETLGLYLQLKRIPPLKAPGMPYFEAEFANLSSILNWARDDARCYRGVADKAPEAICRAYIALKEWEKKR